MRPNTGKMNSSQESGRPENGARNVSVPIRMSTWERVMLPWYAKRRCLACGKLRGDAHDEFPSHLVRMQGEMLRDLPRRTLDDGFMYLRELAQHHDATTLL